MTYRKLRRAAVLGGATGVRIAEAAGPLTRPRTEPPPCATPTNRRRAAGISAVVFIPAQRRRPPWRYEPHEPGHGTACHRRIRRRPPPPHRGRPPDTDQDPDPDA
ncbi:hypothetical protein POF50_023450 [Streptomyces sp. SL13]|uniref:Uncharacterized protein n=1 Tax=Streptantibioticus silvisoli TaxID=2705255 RepID=A0AA90KHT2_9ACTN|nr:hypothetical protein [Streptantibioticus silvisoli]MDI5972255.1 hypothetical protein [Streptantibioticus silvisoli]